MPDGPDGDTDDSTTLGEEPGSSAPVLGASELGSITDGVAVIDAAEDEAGVSAVVEVHPASKSNTVAGIAMTVRCLPLFKLDLPQKIPLTCLAACALDEDDAVFADLQSVGSGRIEDA